VTTDADVTLTFDKPKRAAGVVFILAHGAGGHLGDPLLVDVAAALRALGHGVARFNFAYRDAGRRAPDRAPVLEATWRSVIARVKRAAPKATLVIGGKSMGGRMATHLAAQGDPLAGSCSSATRCTRPSSPRSSATHTSEISASPRCSCKARATRSAT